MLTYISNSREIFTFFVKATYYLVFLCQVPLPGSDQKLHVGVLWVSYSEGLYDLALCLVLLYAIVFDYEMAADLGLCEYYVK